MFLNKYQFDKIVFYICLFLLIIFNLSFTWPMKNIRVTSTFGESRGDHFHTGIDIISPNMKILPVEEGELVFSWDKSLFPTENYPGGGNYKILRHKSGYLSVYMHLEDSPDYKKVYFKDDSIGDMGSTGHSFGRHLHLAIYQLSEDKFLNPLKLFPKITDTIKPDIKDAFVRVDEQYYRIVDNDNIRLTKHYPLLLNIWDMMNKGDRLGVYSLQVTVNGKKVVDNDYSEILNSNNALRISGKNFDELFDEKGYYKAANIEYVEGLNKVSVSTADFSGNQNTKQFSFTVKLDMQQ